MNATIEKIEESNILIRCSGRLMPLDISVKQYMAIKPRVGQKIKITKSKRSPFAKLVD